MQSNNGTAEEKAIRRADARVLPGTILCTIEEHKLCLTPTNKLMLVYPDNHKSTPYIDRAGSLMGIDEMLSEPVKEKVRIALGNIKRAREMRQKDEWRDVPRWMREEAFD